MGDYESDMRTIRDYVTAVTEKQIKMTLAFTGALENVESTFLTASSQEAAPQVLNVVLKSGLKFLEKTAVTAVKAQTGADLGPLVELVHAVDSEIDRAAQAGQSHAAGEWIRDLRTELVNGYTQSESGDALRQQLEDDYNQRDEGQQNWLIGGLQNEIDAVRLVTIPRTETIEVTMYEAWVNQLFNDDCVDGTGNILVQFAEDGALQSATVNATYGNRVADSLNRVMIRAGVERLMDLKVVKKLCIGDSCMCFEPNNVIRKSTDDEAAEAYLTSPQTWGLVRAFR
jgi:hypothetical protein